MTEHLSQPLPSGRKEDALLIRARALSSAGRMAWFVADFPTARAQMEESLALFRQSNDEIGTLDAMSTLILVLTWQGERDAALSHLEEAISMLRGLSNRQELLPVLVGLSRAAAFMVSPEAIPYARTLGEEAMQLARRADDRRNLAWVLNTLAITAYYSGDDTTARPYVEESITLFEELGELYGVSLMTWLLVGHLI